MATLEPRSQVLSIGASASSARAQTSLSPLARRLIGLQLLVLVATTVLLPTVGLSIVWATALPHALGLAVIAAVWCSHQGPHRRANEWFLADTLLVALLMISLTCIVSPAQYGAIALRRPLIDSWLAAADRALGINVAVLAKWTAAHSPLSVILNAAYVSIGPQLVVVLIVLGLVARDRSALWELCFHFHFCLVFTLLALAVFPAACAFNHYGFTSTIDQTRFIGQFSALRAGTFRSIRFDDLEGMISMPSFHAACGLMLPWAVRRQPVLMIITTGLNALMIAATFMSGAHYVIDILASVLLFIISIAVYQKWAGPRPTAGAILPSEQI